MKTNTLKVILGMIAISAIGLIVMRKASASDLLPTVAVTISYLAVAIIVAVAAVDYRVGPKNYASR
jgi:hypothetical protein